MAGESEQLDEIMALKSIYRNDIFTCDVSNKPYMGQIVIHPNSRTFDFGNGVTLRHLSPITLSFSLPSNYPSSSPPDFKLYCIWMTSDQLERLSNRLRELWEENNKNVVFFTWVNFVQQEVLIFLHILFPLNLSEKIMTKLIEHNEMRMTKVFINRSYHTCRICTCVKPVEMCVILEDCGHTFCRYCLKRYLGQIVEDPGCPTCTVQIHKLIRCEDFEDIIYCPRSDCCRIVQPVEDNVENFMICHSCGFGLCAICKLTYHGLKECTGIVGVPKNHDYQKRRIVEDVRERNKMLKKLGSKELPMSCYKCSSTDAKQFNLCRKCGLTWCNPCNDMYHKLRPFDTFDTAIRKESVVDESSSSNTAIRKESVVDESSSSNTRTKLIDIQEHATHKDFFKEYFEGFTSDNPLKAVNQLYQAFWQLIKTKAVFKPGSSMTDFEKFCEDYKCCVPLIKSGSFQDWVEIINTRPIGAMMIIDENKEVLLVKERDNQWGLIKGAVDAVDSQCFINCALRKTRTKIKVDITNLSGQMDFFKAEYLDEEHNEDKEIGVVIFRQLRQSLVSLNQNEIMDVR